MVRIRRFLAQWGLLDVALVAALLLTMYEHRPQERLRQGYSPAPLPPGSETYRGAQVYEPGQVLDGMCHDPGLWIGRSILVRADATTLGDLPAGSLALFSCASDAPNRGNGHAQLYDGGIEIPILCSRSAPCHLTDPRTDPMNPAIQATNQTAPQAANGAATGPLTHIYRTRLITSQDCRAPWTGDGPCLFGEGAALVGR